MKKLIILLLAIFALFTYGCESRDFSETSDSEILANISAYDLYGTWNPVGDDGKTLTLSQSGAKLGDEKGSWSYGEKGVRVQIGDEGAFYGTVSVTDKNIRLEIDRTLYVRGESITKHTLTLENFWDYFELSESASWSENEGARWYSREYTITLKSEYADCFADGIEIKTKLTKVYYDYEIDYENKSFKLTQRDESYTTETVISRGITESGKLVLHTAFLKEGENYSFVAYEDVNVTSVNGKLYGLK